VEEDAFVVMVAAAVLAVDVVLVVVGLAAVEYL